MIILSCQTFNDLQNKVAGIKGLRTLTGMGLRDAKVLIERITPGQSETLNISHSILEPAFNDAVTKLKESGLTVKSVKTNNAARKGIATGIAELVTYATVAGQYDISRALLDVMETHCPEPEEDDDE